MAQTLKEFRQEILDLSDSERINVARNAVNTLAGALPRADLIKLLRLVSRVFVSADKNCDGYEHDLYVAATGDNLSFNEFYDVTNGGSDPAAINDLVNFAQGIADEYRVAIALFGLCLMAHDGTLTVSEQNIFERVLGY